MNDAIQKLTTGRRQSTNPDAVGVIKDPVIVTYKVFDIIMSLVTVIFVHSRQLSHCHAASSGFCRSRCTCLQHDYAAPPRGHARTAIVS